MFKQETAPLPFTNAARAVPAQSFGVKKNPLTQGGLTMPEFNIMMGSEKQSQSDINEMLGQDMSKVSFNEINMESKVAQGLVKSLGASYFADKAGLIGDIFKQVEKEKAEKAKNQESGNRSIPGGGTKLMFAGAGDNKATKILGNQDGVDLFASATGMKSLIVKSGKPLMDNAYIGLQKAAAEPDSKEAVDIDDWLLEDESVEKKPVAKKQHMGKQMTADVPINFIGTNDSQNKKTSGPAKKAPKNNMFMEEML